MGHSSYKLKAVSMAQTEILRVKKWFVFTDMILAESLVPDTAPPPHPPTMHRWPKSRIPSWSKNLAAYCGYLGHLGQSTDAGPAVSLGPSSSGLH